MWSLGGKQEITMHQHVFKLYFGIVKSFALSSLGMSIDLHAVVSAWQICCRFWNTCSLKENSAAKERNSSTDLALVFSGTVTITRGRKRNNDIKSVERMSQKKIVVYEDIRERKINWEMCCCLWEMLWTKCWCSQNWYEDSRQDLALDDYNSLFSAIYWSFQWNYFSKIKTCVSV